MDVTQAPEPSRRWCWPAGSTTRWSPSRTCCCVTGPPEAERQLSFVLTQPVFARRTGGCAAGSTGPARPGLHRLDPAGNGGRTAQRGSASTPSGRLLDVAALPWRPAGPSCSSTADVDVADRSWQLAVDARTDDLLGRDSRLDDDVTVGGIALTALMALLIFTLATARRRAMAQVDAAIAELRGSEEQLRLLLDGAREHAIFMLDEHGRVSSWSRAPSGSRGMRRGDPGPRVLDVLHPEEAAAGRPAASSPRRSTRLRRDRRLPGP